jgi:ribonuclease HII
MFLEILATAEVGIGSVAATEIDRINIRQASLLAMCRALEALPCLPDVALVDGNDPPKLPCPVQTIVKGDANVPSIAAASIVAKVVRDRMMRRLADATPPTASATTSATRPGTTCRRSRTRDPARSTAGLLPRCGPRRTSSKASERR